MRRPAIEPPFSVATLEGEQYVTNGHWIVRLTNPAFGVQEDRVDLFKAARDGVELIYIGRPADGDAALWRSTSEPAFTVAIAMRYHRGLDLENKKLTTVGEKSVIAIHNDDGEDDSIFGYVMPVNRDAFPDDLFIESEGEVASA